MIAAAALFALEHNVDRLADDHKHGRILAKAVKNAPGLALEHGEVETNLVWISIDPKFGSAADFAAKLRDNGILISVLGPQVARACTHLDVDRAQVERAAAAIESTNR